MKEIHCYLHKVSELLQRQNIGVQDWKGFINTRLQKKGRMVSRFCICLISLLVPPSVLCVNSDKI